MTVACRVRLAGDSDVAALMALRRSWVEEQAGAPVTDPDFERAFSQWYEEERSRRLNWLAEFGGEPVGMLNLMIFRRMPKPGRPASRWGYLGNLFVVAEHRDRGIGRRLLDAALRYAREHDFARLVLSPTGRSVPFYRRAGFGDPDMLLAHPVDS